MGGTVVSEKDTFILGCMDSLSPLPVATSVPAPRVARPCAFLLINQIIVGICLCPAVIPCHPLLVAGCPVSHGCQSRFAYARVQTEANDIQATN